MYASDLSTCRTIDSRSKGYPEKFVEFIEVSKKGGISKNTGLVNMSSNNPAVNQVWHLVNYVIEDTNKPMILLLELFGVKKGLNYLFFCQDYEYVTKFKETFVEYMPTKGYGQESKDDKSEDLRIN